jgi:hypothetical protein
MLDLFGIVVSSVLMLLVVVRAAQLDRELPWFRQASVPPEPDRKHPPGFSTRRRSDRNRRI